MVALGLAQFALGWLVASVVLAMVLGRFIRAGQGPHVDDD